MPKGTAFDIETLIILEAKKTKKTGETGTTLFTPGAGKRFRLCGFTLTSSEEETIILSDGSTAFLVVTVPKTPTMLTFNYPDQGYLSIKDANKLVINTKATERELTGTFYGIEDVA